MPARLSCTGRIRAMPKGDIELPTERRRDPALPAKRFTAADGADALEMDLNPLPDWGRKLLGQETRKAKQDRWAARRVANRRR